MVNNPPVNAEDIRDAGSIPGLGRSPGGGHGNPLQFFCLDNSMDEAPGGLKSMGCKESGTMEATKHAPTS